MVLVDDDWQLPETDLPETGLPEAGLPDSDRREPGPPGPEPDVVAIDAIQALQNARPRHTAGKTAVLV